MKKKKEKRNEYQIYYESLDEFNKSKIDNTFDNLNKIILINKSVKEHIINDYKNVLLFYSHKISLDDTLSLINPSFLGSFYSRKSTQIYHASDGAKVYPLSMRHQQMSVFRISFYLKEEVNPIILQMALNFLIKRFPPFATTVKKGFFWYYLESSRHYYKVNKESGLPCQSLDLRYFESPSFRVIYYENRISVEYFHLLTDGSGGTEFIKALIMEYYRLLGVKDESIHKFDLNETSKSSEFESGFDLMEKKENPPSFIDKPALEMSSKLSFTKPCQVIHFKMNLDKLKEVSKSYNATITEYILYLMFLASKASIDDTEGNISIQVPINLRKYYDTLTLGNFSLYCGISLPLNEVDSKDNAIDNIKLQMKEKTSKLSMENMATSTGKFIKTLSYIPLIIKGPITKIVYGYVGDRLYTSTLSNLGKVEMDKVYQDHILSMDFVLGTTVSNRATVSIVTINNILTLSISKNTTDPTFENILYDKLIKDGIELVVEGSAIYGN